MTYLYKCKIIILLVFSFLTLLCQEPDTLRIGNQVWMQKNLNIETEDSYCYGNDSANCEKYGHLYNWETALHICPEGFHLPTDEEWTEVANYLGGNDIAGNKLKAGGSSGFNALLAGNYNKNLDIFSYLYRDTYFWTSTPFSNNTAWVRQLSIHQTNVNRSTIIKEYYFSVRCVMDEIPAN